MLVKFEWLSLPTQEAGGIHMGNSYHSLQQSHILKTWNMLGNLILPTILWSRKVLIIVQVRRVCYSFQVKARK